MNKTSQIINLLSIRHRKDVFVTECKTGSTWDKHRKFDAWVMRKSWINHMIFGYEVKISRSDFLQDKKWRDYLPYCHKFYFVTPWGLIDKQEIEEPAGLIYASKNMSKLYIQKRVSPRIIQDPINIYIYLLMSRTILVSPTEHWDYELGKLKLIDITQKVG